MPARGSLKKTLDRLDEDVNEEELMEVIEAMVGFAAESVDFDDASRSVRDRRARHKQEYERMIGTLIRKKQHREPTEEDFYGSTEAFEHNLRFYIPWCARDCVPRMKNHNSVTFHTIYERLQSILYFANQVKLKNQRNTTELVKNIDMWRIRDAGTRALHFAVRKFQLRLRRHAPGKTFLTRSELLYLLWDNTERRGYTDNTLQHQLAWCLAFTLGLRPMSLGKSRFTEDWLKWKDIKLFFLEDGTLAARILIRNIKAGEFDPDVKSIAFTVTSADAESVTMSIPHRILALLLHRGLIDEEILGVDDPSMSVLEKIIKSRKVNIPIKSAHYEDPVFLRMGPKGIPLAKPQPMSAQALTDGLQRACMEAGLPPYISFYAWRRSFATLFGLKKGDSLTSEAMGHRNLHDKGTVLKSYYKEGTLNVDVAANAYHQRERTRDELITPIVLQRVEGDDMDPVLIDQMVENHPDVIEAPAHEKKNARKRVARMVRISIRLNSLEEQQKQVTIDEVIQRRKDLNALFNKLSTSFKTASPEDIQDADIGFDVAPTVQLNDDEEAELPELMRLGRQRQPQQQQDAADVPADASVDAVANEDTVSIEMGWNLIRSQLERSSNVEQITDLECTACQIDNTATTAQRAKRYTKSQLAKHEKSNFHSDKATRERELRASNKKSPKGKTIWSCRFCDCEFEGRPGLMNHMLSSQQSDEHLLLVGDAGWLDNETYDTLRQPCHVQPYIKIKAFSPAPTLRPEIIGDSAYALAKNVDLLEQMTECLHRVRLAVEKRKIKGTKVVQNDKKTKKVLRARKRYLELIGRTAEEEQEQIEEAAVAAAEAESDDEGLDEFLLELEEDDADDQGGLDINEGDLDFLR